MATDIRAAASDPPPSDPEVASLWRHKDFNRLWLGQSISVLGSELTTLALPLTAILTLHATAWQVGVLNGARTAASLLLTVFAGVLIDRFRRRPMMIGADLARAFFVALIPILAFAGDLTIEVLYFVALALGALTVIFEIAHSAYLPSLLTSSQLVQGNSRMAATASVGAIAGSSTGGILIDLFRPAVVLIGDAISFVVSAVSLSLIRTPEPRPERPPGHARGAVRRFCTDIADGLGTAFRNAYARPLILNSTGANFGSMIILTLFILYAARDLGFSGTQIGLIYAAGSIGGLVGAVLANRLMVALGYGRATVGAMLAFRVLCLTPFVRGPEWLQMVLFSVIWFVTVFGVVVSNIGQLTLLQYVIPHSLRGRVIGGSRAMHYGVLPLSALVAGALGQQVGVHNGLYVGAAILAPWVLWVLFSPVPALGSLEDAQRLPEGSDESGAS